MNNRDYNVLFNLHTVSGIVISVALFVIFFAGSFSFFRDEIVNWERNEATANSQGMHINFDEALDSIQKNYNLYGRDIEISKTFDERRVNVSLGASKDTLATEETKAGAYFYLDPLTYKSYTYLKSYTLGEFLYRLHFFAQIYYPVGYYLSGFVALFFLFTIVTGVLVHWDKIVSNFYVFRPWAKLKTLWTDAHTGLGMIGLPFQFVYAVTGAFFMLQILLVAPSVFTIYDGDQAQLYEDLEFTDKPVAFKNNPLESNFSINELVSKTKEKWNGFEVSEVHIFNYGDKNMHVAVEGALGYDNQLTAPGKAVYKISPQLLVFEKDPIKQASYLDQVKNLLNRLHYGDYGGYLLKIASFILGIISCLVIVSGVMIWLVARDKKNMPEKKRKFNNAVVRIYLAICLSMFPVTALAFIAVKIYPNEGQSFIYSFYFISWLLFSTFLFLKKNLRFMTRFCLILGGILAIFIPLLDGFVSGNWVWSILLKPESNLYVVDLLWLLIAITSLFAAYKSAKMNTAKNFL